MQHIHSIHAKNYHMDHWNHHALENKPTTSPELYMYNTQKLPYNLEYENFHMFIVITHKSCHDLERIKLM